MIPQMPKFPPSTTRSEVLPKYFIEAVLDKLKIIPDQFSYVELGPADSINYLQHVSITATPGGWVFYEELKKSHEIVEPK